LALHPFGGRPFLFFSTPTYEYRTYNDTRYAAIPPPITPISKMQAPQPTSYTNSLAKSLTIDEMRALHRQATTEAEAKKTELKLVLASRYRELVGSSDEVLGMQRDANVLDELVSSIPSLVDRLIECVQVQDNSESKDADEDTESSFSCAAVVSSDVMDRLQLADSPRAIHSCLDVGDVHGAATALIQTFALMTKYTRQYPLANAMARITQEDFVPSQNAALLTQVKMIYLHLQSIPLRTIETSKQILLNLSKNCATTARALSALHLLNVQQIPQAQRANKLMDLYFDSKAKLIHGLLDQLSPKPKGGQSNPSRSKKVATYYTEEATDAAEKTISEILLILQYDVILYPYQIFMLRKYQMEADEENVIDSLPLFDSEQLKSKASHFLAAHLPMIRSKVKTILVGIAGTTASRLGSMRQSLYDKTDGAECLATLSSGVCTWDDAIHQIDVKVVTRALEGLTTTASTATSNASMSTHQRGFSLWGTLFSNTFSSLVHSILSTSFHSVHRQVVAALRASLANAPPFREILPHEAYRNTLYIATELDKALKKVSDDAHELLVHAEEREESERRLKQSLYVQTCEIIGRLLNELRRMLIKSTSQEDGRDDDDEEATKELIVGRLCYLLKFRLPSLPILLDPNSSPAVIASKSGGKVGMISIIELQSAFDIADVDDDGLITYEESMEAMEGAFSGTHFHGGEMVRDTMLLSSGSDGVDMKSSGAPRTLTLSELALLSARGLRHAVSGPESALGTFQGMLDDIVDTCFTKWSRIALAPSLKSCMSGVEQFIDTASSVTDSEWKRLHLMGSTSEEDLLQQEIGDALGESEGKSEEDKSTQIGSVSSFLVSYFISITSVLNQSICPSDSMQPFPSVAYASAMGIESLSEDTTMVKLLRSCLVRESLQSLSSSINMAMIGDGEDSAESEESKLNKCGASSLVHVLMDITFVQACYFKRNQLDFGGDRLMVVVDDDEEEDDEPISIAQQSEDVLKEVQQTIVQALSEAPEIKLDECLSTIETRHQTVFTSCSMFFTSLFGEGKTGIESPAMDGQFDAFSAFSGNDSVPLVLNPLASSRRFMLLPIQAEQSVKELQLIKNLEKERSNKAEAERMSASSAAASAVSSSFGFFSSMLKQKK